MIRAERFLLLAIAHLAVAAVFPIADRATAAEKPLRAYFVGNSITDTIRYAGLAKLAESRGLTLTWGRHMIPGAPLSWIWQHPKDGFQQEPFGYYPQALGDYAWDVLSLEPFDRHLDEDEGDLTMARRFIDLAVGKNPDVQVYIYSRWPRRDEKTKGQFTIDFAAKWGRKYTGKYDGSEESKDYFERVVGDLRKAYPKLAKPILMVPVGDVLVELNDRMHAGKVPGYSDVAELYADQIHFNNVGSYIVATTFFATLFKQDPNGLPAAPYNDALDPNRHDRQIDDKLAAAIQDVAWTVVSRHPLAGVVTRDKAQPPDSAK